MQLYSPVVWQTAKYFKLINSKKQSPHKNLSITFQSSSTKYPGFSKYFSVWKKTENPTGLEYWILKQSNQNFFMFSAVTLISYEDCQFKKKNLIMRFFGQSLCYLNRR